MSTKIIEYGFTQTSKVINRFGNAWLIRVSDGRFRLVGGSEADYAAAREWASLFAHEIVFSRQSNSLR